MGSTKSTAALLLLAALIGCAKHHATPSPAPAPRLTSVVFASRAEIELGTAGVSDAVLADLDGDGNQDLAVTTLGGELEIVLGQGNGNFVSVQRLPVPGFALDVEVGDLDGDLDLDLAVLRSRDGSVSTFLNDGDATFGPAGTIAVPADGASMVLGDCDGDGRLDLLLAHFGRGSLTQLLGNGDGTFHRGAPVAVPGGIGLTGLALADLDGDGLADLAVADGGGDCVHLLRRRAGGGFEVAQRLGLPGFPFALAAGDLGGDGVVDLAVSCYTGRGVAVVTGALGTMAVVDERPLGGVPGLCALRDVTGDGALDLVVGVLDRSQVSVFAGTGGTTFAGELRLPATGQPFRCLVGDVDHDGRPDLLATSGDRVLSYYAGGGSAPGAVGIDPGVDRPEVVAAADMNGDGRAEVVVAGIGTSRIAILGLQSGADLTGLARLAEIDVGLPVLGVVDGDLDGDGRIDFAVDTANGVKILANESRAGGLAFELLPAAPNEVLLPASGPFQVAAADMDGDGVLDLVTADVFAETVKVLRSRGGRFRYEATPLEVPLPGVPVGLAVADFTGDGRPDVAVSRSSSALVTVLRNTGSGALVPWLDVPVGAGPNYLRSADFDGDRRADLVVSTALTDSVVVLLARAGGFASVMQPVGAAPTGLLARDLDRDRRVDILVASYLGGDCHVLLGDGRGGFGGGLRFPATQRATSAALADVDGDSLPEAVLASTESGRVDVYRNLSR